MAILSSDILIIKKDMMEEETFNTNKEIFNKMCIDYLKLFT